MTQRSCPVCDSDSSAKLFLKKNFNPDRISSFSFASRKLPEFMCHQLMQCEICDLVYANEPPDQSVLAQAYHAASFDSAQEADDAAAAYENAIKPVLSKLNCKDRALEIGAGTGTFLEVLKKNGFQIAHGVEPSSAAIDAAPEHRKSWIKESIFKESDFEPSSYDLICCFMTLEHVRDPNEIVSAAMRLLKPGGAIALVTHDYRSHLNRILGKRSPIIDIEHMQLFSDKSIKQILQRNGYSSIDVKSFHNCYALRYWMRLFPIPNQFKKIIIKILEFTGTADIKLKLNVGNIIAYGFRAQG